MLNFLFYYKTMSGKQNNNIASNEETFTNPAFPNKIFKKVNGKDVIVGYIKPTKTKTKFTKNT